MAYVRAKKIKRQSKKATPFYRENPEEYTYYQLVHGYRDESGRVRQEVLAHLGRNPTPEAAIEEWEEMAGWRKERAASLRRAAELIRSGLLTPTRPSWSRWSWLAPKVGTEFDEEIAANPWRYGASPKGWFRHSHSGRREDGAETAEAAATELEAKAKEFEERIARLRPCCD